VVTDLNCDCRLQVPNAFSPNGDGINDDFRPVTNCTPIYYHLSVFDRDGQLLFESYTASSYWNGTFKGKNVPVGTYYYFLKVKGLNDTDFRQQAGSVTVLK
jgi:gliding motility-associated-like protein